MNDNKPLDRLAQAHAHIVSRHLDVPPTPHSTIVTLINAAKRRRKRQRILTYMGVCSKAAGLAAVVVLMAWFLLGVHSPSSPTRPPPAAYSVPDPGMDTIVWDMEVEALFFEVDAAIFALDEDTTLNAMAFYLLTQDGTRL